MFADDLVRARAEFYEGAHRLSRWGRTRTVTPLVRGELWRRREVFAARLRQSALNATGVFTLLTTKRHNPTTAPDESHSVDAFEVIRRRWRPDHWATPSGAYQAGSGQTPYVRSTWVDWP